MLDLIFDCTFGELRQLNGKSQYCVRVLLILVLLFGYMALVNSCFLPKPTIEQAVSDAVVVENQTTQHIASCTVSNNLSIVIGSIDEGFIYRAVAPFSDDSFFYRNPTHSELEKLNRVIRTSSNNCRAYTAEDITSAERSAWWYKWLL
ncbi:MAG TPA: hypothetical protein VJ576_01150 [Rhodocyclaceae bacterium]|nr:hypothetical protein [Rhodocyclaceae bacterium]